MVANAAEAAARAEEAAVPSDFHAESEIKNVSLDTLNVDRSYQRDVSITLVEQIRNNWDEVASELILVSKRDDGTLWIVNGQHRTAAARLKGEKKIWARVVSGLGPEQEAALRLKTNVRLTDRPLERFRAQVRAGDPESLAIVSIVKRVGSHVNESPSAEEGINSITTLEAIYRVDDGALLLSTLEFVKDTFGEIRGKSAISYILRSVAWFLMRHSDANMERVAANLKGIGPAALDRHARTIQATMGGALWLNYYRSMIELYNEGLGEKSRLEWRTSGATSRDWRVSSASSVK